MGLREAHRCGEKAIDKEALISFPRDKIVTAKQKPTNNA
jgi:hypothetical protein